MPDRAPEIVVSSDGVRIAMHDLGGPSGDSTAPVLIFSHATGLHGQVWKPMASILNGQFHCVAVDLRGHGLSELPPAGTLGWSGMADDILAALDGNGFPAGACHGIGHSMGGAALVLAAARRTGAFRTLWLYEPVIIPADTWPLSDTENPMSERAARRRDRFDSLEQAYEHYRSKAPLDQLHPDALRAYVEGGFAPTRDAAVTLRCRPSTEAEVFRQAPASGAWEALASLELPVAVVAGRSDGPGPGSFARAIAEALTGGILMDHSGVGHFGPLEDPKGMAADAAAWVQKHPW